MPMHPLDILTIVGPIMLSIIGVGIALAALTLKANSRAEDRFDKAMIRSDNAMARSEERFDKAMARGEERFDNAMTRSDERFDNAMAEIAADRRAHQASMDEFRRQMQRLAERQSRVEGRHEPDPDPESVAAE